MNNFPRFLISTGPLRIVSHRKIKKLSITEKRVDWEEIDGVYEVDSYSEVFGQDHNPQSLRILNLLRAKPNATIMVPVENEFIKVHEVSA